MADDLVSVVGLCDDQTECGRLIVPFDDRSVAMIVLVADCLWMIGRFDRPVVMIVLVADCLSVGRDLDDRSVTMFVLCSVGARFSSALLGR